MTTPHVPERVLLAVLDGAPVDASDLEHVERCTECRSHFEELASAERAVARLFEEAQPETIPDFDREFMYAVGCAADPRPREEARRGDRIGLPVSGRRRYKVAAAAVLALLLLVPPVRAWVVDTVRLISDPRPEAVSEVGAEGDPGSSSNTVSFLPRSPVLRILASEAPASVVVRPSTGESVSVSVGAPLDVMVLADGVQLAGPAGTVIAVTIPESIGRLLFVVSDSIVWSEVVPRPLGAEWRPGGER